MYSVFIQKKKNERRVDIKPQCLEYYYTIKDEEEGKTICIMKEMR